MSRVDDFKNLAQEMSGAHESRVKILGELVVDTHKMLEDFGREDKERTNEVGKMLNDFDKAHAEMSAQLKADLAKDETDRVAQAQIEIKERVGAVTELLDDFRKEKEEAATAWQNLVSTMEGVRGGRKAPAPVTKEEVKEPVAEVKPVEEKPEEEAVAEAEPVEVTPEIAENQRQVFEYLADHSDGTRMVVLEREFGIARIQMVRILKKLMDDNKVEKRDLLYFAI